MGLGVLVPARAVLLFHGVNDACADFPCFCGGRVVGATFVRPHLLMPIYDENSPQYGLNKALAVGTFLHELRKAYEDMQDVERRLGVTDKSLFELHRLVEKEMGLIDGYLVKFPRWTVVRTLFKFRKAKEHGFLQEKLGRNCGGCGNCDLCRGTSG